MGLAFGYDAGMGERSRRLLTLVWWASVVLSTSAAEKVTIKGSNTFGEYLGPQLIAEFRRENPGIEFQLETKGTATGIAGVIAGECDLGATSRTISRPPCA